MKPYVGNTPIVEASSKEFLENLGIGKLRIKDESVNPCGTWKDRRSQQILKEVQGKKVDKLVLITQGNAGYSLGKLAEGSGLKVVSIMDLETSKKTLREVQKVCHRVIQVDLSKVLSPEEIQELARESDSERIWDVSNGYQEAYEQLFKEIDPLDPDFIICPVGSGESFVGLHQAIQKKGSRTKLVGIQPESAASLAEKLTCIWSPYQTTIEEILRTHPYTLIKVTEEEIEESYRKAKKLMRCEPSSGIVLSALSKISFPKKANVVLINSGKGNSGF